MDTIRALRGTPLLLAAFLCCAPPPTFEPIPESMEYEAAPLPPAGGPYPEVLFPRHRIQSAAPPILLFVPADPGPVQVEVRLGNGAGKSFLTRDRSLPWPSGLPLLASGEAGWITVRTGDRIARAGFVRAPWRRFDLRERTAALGLASLLARGQPAEAFLLGAIDPAPGGPDLEEARLRADLPVLGIWRKR